MTADVEEEVPAPDAFRGGKRKPKQQDLDRYVAAARRELGLGAEIEWRIVSSRMKLNKTLFEIDESGPKGSRRLIAKTSSERRANISWRGLQDLWHGGFRPPALTTVCEPVARVTDLNLQVQEKAPGEQITAAFAADGPERLRFMEAAAHWLADLHESSVNAPRWSPDISHFAGLTPAMCDELGTAAKRATSIFQSAQSVLSNVPEDDIRPSHGDYHPQNIFVDSERRITAIDLDTWGTRDRAIDVAYFIAQLGIMGKMELGSFAATAGMRERFLECYERLCGWRPAKDRMGAYMALSMILSLHFDLCVLHTGKTAMIEPWLQIAERCLKGNLDL